MAIICGIDEAGRGPIIGPMVLAGVAIDEKDLDKLSRLGVKDSKQLSPAKRKELFPKIISLVKYSILKIEAREIDSHNSVGTNLNKLEALKAAQIIEELKPDVVYVDSPEPADGSKFGRMIEKYLKNVSPEIIAEHKADVNYPIVSAASILAKVTRDEEVAKIEKEIGKPIGSGYCADPTCKKFLEEHYHPDHEKFLRKSWQPFKDLKKKKEQKSLGEF